MAAVAVMLGGTSFMAGATELEKLVMPGPVITGHADIEADCDLCHVAFSRQRQRELCLDCHEEVAADLAGASGFHGRDQAASTDKCAGCHTEHEGREIDIVNLDESAFNHDLTDFVLIGSHVETECADCHVGTETFREASSVCFDCHQDDDDHAGGLGEDCADCHSPTDWKDTGFDHATRTDYALLGGHADTSCTACHVGNRFENTPTECYGCHADDDEHAGLNGTDCAFCHTARDWGEVLFDHVTETGFALLGQHGEIACTDCHTANKFEVALEATCIGCHRDDDEHKGLNGNECGDCHTPDDWAKTTFDHAVATRFPLLGAHAETACGGCHELPAHEVKLSMLCYDCHQEDDAHEGQEGEDCAACHNETDWKTGVLFDHGLTRFPLIGVHIDTECASCHETARFQDAPEACNDCHRDDDVHSGSLGAACDTCHNPNDWAFWVFDHNRQTQFALDGAHTELICSACHTRPLEQQSLAFGDCAACHRRDDIHRGEFGRDCARCHNTRTFLDARSPLQ